MTNPDAVVELMRWQLGILGSGIVILIGVVGYFAHKLVTTQEKQTELLQKHDKWIEKTDLRLNYLEAARR